MTKNSWYGKKVLITGVCGTIGRELLHQVVSLNPAEITGLDNNESALFFLEEEYRAYPHVHLFLGEIRDRDTLTRKMQDTNIVLHAAGLKHVGLCEKSPTDAVQTNILGVQNVIDAANANQVERVIFTSTDKAVNPTSVMGTSKLMGERLMTAANAHRRSEGPIFACTRFGNVLGSRGSVIPLFRQQIARGGPVTLTDPDMSRFIMTLTEAVRLVMDSVFLAQGGEVFVTKMPVVRIADLAAVMVQELALRHGFDPKEIEIKVIGNRPGEKLYEELLNDEEIRRIVELPNYFVITPAIKSVYETIAYQYPDMVEVTTERPYNSAVEQAMTQDELRRYLLQHHLLEEGK